MWSTIAIICFLIGAVLVITQMVKEKQSIVLSALSWFSFMCGYSILMFIFTFNKDYINAVLLFGGLLLSYYGLKLTAMKEKKR